MSALLRASLGVCAVLTLLLLALTLERVGERGRFARAFSSYGSGPEGARALYLLSAELGYTPLRWSQDLARLPPRATLIALGDCSSGLVRPISRYERVELTRWIAAGGVLLVAGTPHYLPAGFGVEFEADPNCPESASEADNPAHVAKESGPKLREPDAGVAKPESSQTPAAAPAVSPSEIRDAGVNAPDAGRADAAIDKADAAAADEADDPAAPTWGVPMDRVLRGLPIVPFRDPGRLQLGSDVAADTLIAVPQLDRETNTRSLMPLAVAVRYGQGRVIALASANMLQNAELETSEGAALYARLLRAYAGKGPLLFDEYHMGLGERRSLMQYLRQLGVMPGVFQLFLCALVLLWRAGARFGGVRSGIAASPLGTTSFVTALGGLYQGAGDSAAAVRLIARAALARIATHHGVGMLQAGALERVLRERGATHASLAVRSILAAVSSNRAQTLPAIVQGIDAAVASANDLDLVDAAGAPSARTGLFGWLPARKP